MLDLKRAIAFALAIAGLAASLMMPWWRGEFLEATLEVTLRGIDLCVPGGCASVPAGGAFGGVGLVAFVCGCASVLLLISGGLLPALSGRATRARAYVAAMLYMAFAAMAYASLEIPPQLVENMNFRSTRWFWIGLGSAALVLLTPLLAMLEPLPPIKLEPKREGLPEARLLPGKSGPVAPIAMSIPAPAVTAPALVERSGLRFALSTAEATESALLTVTEDGRIRELAWSRIGGALARELTVQRRLDDPLLVDLIPAGEPPLRFLATTRIQLPGAAPTSGRDAMRRLLAYARAMHPDLQVEASTADFLYKRTELPAWSPPELERYDSRYG